MTKSTEVIADFVSALAQHREQMIGLAVDLRRHSVSRQVTSGIDVRQYESGPPVIESYLDAELTDGRSIALWVEIRSDTERSTLSGSLLQNSTSGQDVISDFGERSGLSPSELMCELRLLTEELVRAMNSYRTSGWDTE